MGGGDGRGQIEIRGRGGGEEGRRGRVEGGRKGGREGAHGEPQLVGVGTVVAGRDQRTQTIWKEGSESETVRKLFKAEMRFCLNLKYFLSAARRAGD